MRKKYLALVLSLAMAFSATSCASDPDKKDADKKGTVVFERAKSEYYGKVTLADYSDFVVYSPEVNIDDADIKSTIDGLMLGYKTADKEVDVVSEDCLVNISYIGTIEVDGEPYQFPKGSAENQELDIANNNYIPGYAEGLVGAKKGEEVTLNLNFPDTYGGTTEDADGNEIKLAGMPVVFKVTVNSIKEYTVPELTDEYAKENFNKYIGCETAKDVEDYFRDYQVMQNVGSSGAVKDYMDKCKVELNEDNIKAELKSANELFDKYLEEQSKTREEYYEQSEIKSDEEFNEESRKSLEERYKLYAIVCAICEKEGIELTKEEFKNRLSQLAAQNNMEAEALEEQIKKEQNMTAEEYFPVQFLYQDVIKFLVKNATVKEGERPTEAESEAEVTK